MTDCVLSCHVSVCQMKPGLVKLVARVCVRKRERERGAVCVSACVCVGGCVCVQFLKRVFISKTMLLETSRETSFLYSY